MFVRPVRATCRIEQGTTRASLTLDGFTPGETAAFRVVATKNGLRSAPSGAATIYPVAPSAPMLSRCV